MSDVSVWGGYLPGTHPHLVRSEPRMDNLATASRGQQVLLLKSYVGAPPVHLELKDGRTVRVLIVGVAREDRAGNPTRESVVVATDYLSGNMTVYPLASLSGVVPGEWNLTDPRHPDYEDPGQVIRPARGTSRRVGSPRTESHHQRSGGGGDR